MTSVKGSTCSKVEWLLGGGVKVRTAIGVSLLSLAALFSIFICVYFLMFGKRSKLLYSFIATQVLTALWSLSHAAELLAFSRTMRWITVCFMNAAIFYIGFAWLYFAAQYTAARWRGNKRVILLLLAIPTALYIGFLTNHRHALMYSTFELRRMVFGILFWIHLAFVYLYIIAGTLMIIRHSRRTIGFEKKRALLLSLAVFMPLLSNVFHITRVARLPFDITPISFSLSFLFFAVATFKYRFLSVIPAALRKVFESIEDSIILLDNEGAIIASNPAFKHMFGADVMDSIDDFVVNLQEKATDPEDYEHLLKAVAVGNDTAIYGEIRLVNIPCRPRQLQYLSCDDDAADCLNSAEPKVFRFAVQPVYERKQGIENIGRVVTLTDITPYKRLTEELEEKNQELTEVNRQLKEYTLAVSELAAIKERNRMARDIHDTLGHTLTLLTKIQETALVDCGMDDIKVRTALEKANGITRDGLRELRLAIHKMMPDMRESETLHECLGQLAASFQGSGVRIEVMFDGDGECQSPAYTEVVYRICQEAVTNSLKHGQADEIHIMVRLLDEGISLFVIDNGCGCKEIQKGYGLAGMEERVKKLDGRIVFGSDGEHGFNIHVEIPLRGDC